MGIKRWLLCLLGCLLPIMGCEKSAQIHYSPDFKQALYRSSGESAHAYLLQADGKVLKDLGPSRGGYAWSEDSKTAYVGIQANAKPSLYEIGWVGEQPLVPQSDTVRGTTILQVTGDQSTPVAHVVGEVLYMRLAPGGQWLGIVVRRDETQDTFTLYVLNTQSQILYLARSHAGFGICFTAPDRLVCVVPGNDPTEGQLIELILWDKPQPLIHDRLLYVLWQRTGWISGNLDDLLLVTWQSSFPSTRKLDYGTLYHFSRRDGGLVALAENVGGLFAPSPDGSRILFEQVGDKPAVAVMNANGSGVQVLRPRNDKAPSMYPAWVGNDRLTWDDGAGEVVEYQLAPDGKLQPLRTLSKGWDPKMKPRAVEP